MMKWHEPNRAREETTRSPLFTWHIDLEQEFLSSLDSLQRGFIDGDLVYETCVLEPCLDQEL